ncbi:MAG: hypothetical protein WCQ47_03375 [bacterium]
MKRFFTTLLIILIPAVLNAGVVYDIMPVDLALLPPLSAYATTLQFPTVYTTTFGKITTADKAYVRPGGINGSNAVVYVTGTAKQWYLVNPYEGTIELSGPGSGFFVHWNLLGYMWERQFNDDGADEFVIEGDLNIEKEGGMAEGSYKGVLYLGLEYI